MKFNVYYTLRGPSGRTIEAGNNTNPVQCANLASLLIDIANSLPGNEQLGIQAIGVRVEGIQDDD